MKPIKNLGNFRSIKPSLIPWVAYRFCSILVCLLFSFGAIGQSRLDKIAQLTVQQKTVPEALSILSKNAEVEFAFSKRFFTKNKKISLALVDRPLSEILQSLLKDTGIGFKEIDGQVVFYQLPKIKPKKFSLSGYIEDATNGERLIAAAVYSLELGLGTVTNEYGFYSLSLPENISEVSISYLGYREEKKIITLIQNQHLNIQLQPSLTLSEIIVTPTLQDNFLLPSPTNGQRLLPDEFKAAPDLAGESDLMRIAQLLPGIQTGADGLGGLHVRGGNADQNLVLLDGVPVYNPDHLMGIFSVFNTEVVKSAKLLRGGFPARYGGRVSSVFDVRTREGNTKKLGGGLSTGLVSAKAHLEGPFAKGKGSFLLTGRSTHTDFVLSELSRKAFFDFEDTGTNYEFYDLNAKLSYRFSDKDRLYFSFYKGDDHFTGSFEEFYEEEFAEDTIDFGSQSELELNWGNTISSLRWNHVIGPKLFANATLTFSQYQFSSFELTADSPLIEEEEEEGTEAFFYGESQTKIEDNSLRVNFDFAPNSKHYFRFGLALTDHFFRPESGFADTSGLLEFDEIDELEFNDFEDLEFGFDLETEELELYVEDEFKLGKKWHFNLGLRFSAFFGDKEFEDKNFYNLEPRVILRHDLSATTSLHASLTKNVQYLRRLFFNEINLPQDVWIPPDEFQKPQIGWQTGLGLEKKIAAQYHLSTEVYYKDMKNLQAATVDPEKYEFDSQDFLGDGRSYGFELMFRKTKGTTGGWLAYTWSKSERIFQNGEEEAWFTSRFDRRHDFKIYLYQHLNEHWQLSANWLMASPMTQLLSQEIGTEDPLPTFPERGDIRSDPYHRLDLGLSRSFKFKKTKHLFKLSLYNAYNRKNPAFYRKVATDSGYKLKPVNLLQAQPGVYYGFKF